MRIKNQKQARVSRVVREMHQRHAAAYSRWLRQEVAATKCRYRGYFTTAVGIAYGHHVGACAHMPRQHMWRVALGDEYTTRRLLALCRDRRAKKLARRIRGMFCYVSVAPWRVARRWA